MINTSGADFELNGENLDITFYQGKTLGFSFVWGGDTPIDVTGFKARMQLRKKYNSKDFIVEMTTENGRIVMGTNDGLIYITMTAEEMAALKPCAGVWDLELINPDDNLDDPDGRVVTVQSGAFVIASEVTRDNT